MSEPKLKPCPFCGRQPNITELSESKKIIIYCPFQPCRCEAIGWSNNEAETQWNRRAK
jgi:hypothetical protein